MSPEIARQLGRIEQGQLSLERAVQHMDMTSSASRKQLHDAVEKIGLQIAHHGHRLENLEKVMPEAQKDLARFRAMEQQARGAGMFGRVIWAVSGFLIAAGVWFLTHVPGVKP